MTAATEMSLARLNYNPRISTYTTLIAISLRFNPKKHDLLFISESTCRSPAPASQLKL